MATEVNVKTSDSQAAPVTRRTRHQQRMPWQRLALSLFGIAIVVGIWRWATFHMYSLPVHAISGFVTLTVNAQYAITVIVIWFITGKLVYDWKNQTTSTIVEEGKQLFEHKESKEEKVVTVRTEGGAKAFAEEIE